MMLGAVIVGLLVLAMFYGLGGTFGRGLFEGFQGGKQAPEVNTFTMYYADWCGHCKKAKPEMEELVKKGVIEKGGKKCEIRMISPENEPEKAAGKPIKGFPTFLMETADGQVVEYKGERSTKGYLDFINKTLSGGEE
jgi:thiol-disulfide isomerase/thioredoxin